MTPKRAAELRSANAMELAKMNPIGAGTHVQVFLKALERNGPVYLRLKNAAGRRVEFDVVEGDRDHLARVAKAVGVTVTDTAIESVV